MFCQVGSMELIITGYFPPKNQKCKTSPRLFMLNQNVYLCEYVCCKLFVGKLLPHLSASKTWLQATIGMFTSRFQLYIQFNGWKHLALPPSELWRGSASLISYAFELITKYLCAYKHFVKMPKGI